MSGSRLAGKRAIVTGAAQGLGAEVVRAFLTAGASVLATDVDDDKCQAAIDSFVQSSGVDLNRVAYQPLDVRDERAWTAAVDRCAELFGPVNVLVLNARRWVRGRLVDTAMEDWDRLFDVNLRGCALGMRSVLPTMCANHSGSIISIGSSMGGEQAAADGSAYQAAKAGLTALTRSVAVAHGRDGVRANAIHSGPMLTETIIEHGFDTEIKRIAAHFPIARPAAPSEVAAVATFLASDESSYITASKIVPDGGSSSAFMVAEAKETP